MTTEDPFEVTKSEEEWKAQLPADRYAVLRRAGTEPPWSGDLLHVDGEGVFRCAGCGAELFDTDAKFESGTGWPSFDRARAAGTVLERRERGFVMARTEILCARCGGHLGHVFPDGPTDTGQRYCVNSLSLTYEPESEPAPGRRGLTTARRPSSGTGGAPRPQRRPTTARSHRRGGTAGLGGGQVCAPTPPRRAW